MESDNHNKGTGGNTGTGRNMMGTVRKGGKQVLRLRLRRQIQGGESSLHVVVGQIGLGEHPDHHFPRKRNY